MEEFGGAGVDEEIELETQAKENVGGVLIGRHAGIAERAEENGVEVVTKHFDSAGGEGDVFAEIFVGAPVEVHEFDRTAMLRRGGLDAFHGDGDDFLADAVAGNNRDTGLGTAVAKGNVGHGRCSDGCVRCGGTVARQSGCGPEGECSF